METQTKQQNTDEQDLILSELNRFTGTENYYKASPLYDLKLTEYYF